MFSPTHLVNLGAEFEHQDVPEPDFISRFGMDNADLALPNLQDCISMASVLPEVEIVTSEGRRWYKIL